MARGHVRQRTAGRWQITIELPPDPGTGQRRQHIETVRGTKKEAERRMVELIAKADSGLAVPKGKLLTREWLERWLDQDVRPYRAPKTAERYAAVVRKHLIPHIGGIRLSGLAPTHVKDLLAALTTSGMAPAGVDLVRTVLHAALKSAIQQELLARNVVEATTLPRIEWKEIAPPDIEAISTILNLAETTGTPFFPALHLLAYSGARRGEVLALDWEHVDLEAGALAITRSLGRTEKGLQFGPPKTPKARRVIDLDGHTIEILRTHRGQQLLEKMQAQEAYRDQGLVFADPLGDPINPMKLTRAFQSLAKRTGVDHVTIHQLRHFHASVLLQQKQSLFSVSRRLGHASISTTADLYGHMLPGAGKEQADAFANAMKRRPADRK